MNIIGTVVTLEKDVAIAKNGGGSYPGARLAYRDKDGSLKEQNFHQNALKFNKAVANGLDNITVGDVFTMVKEKEGEFWNVKQIFKGEGQETQATNKPAQTTQAAPRSAPASSGGNWPTAEERAKTQVHIIRQNSVTNAVSYINAVGNKKATPQDVIEVAMQFEDFIHGRTVKNANPGALEDMEDDIPF